MRKISKKSQRILAVLLIMVFAGIGTYYTLFSSAATFTSNTIVVPDPTGRLNEGGNTPIPQDNWPSYDIIKDQIRLAVTVPSVLHDGSQPRFVYVSWLSQGTVTNVTCQTDSACATATTISSYPQYSNTNLSYVYACLEIQPNQISKQFVLLQIDIAPDSPEAVADWNGSDGSGTEGMNNTVIVGWRTESCKTNVSSSMYTAPNGSSSTRPNLHTLGSMQGNVIGDYPAEANPADNSGNQTGKQTTGTATNQSKTVSSANSSAADQTGDSSNSVAQSSDRGSAEQVDNAGLPSPFYDGKEYSKGSDGRVGATFMKARDNKTLWIVSVLIIVSALLVAGFVYIKKRAKAPTI